MEFVDLYPKPNSGTYDLIGDIPIQSEGQKSWVVGANHGIAGVGGGTIGVVLHIITFGNESLNSRHSFSDNKMLREFSPIHNSQTMMNFDKLLKSHLSGGL